MNLNCGESTQPRASDQKFLTCTDLLLQFPHHRSASESGLVWLVLVVASVEANTAPVRQIRVERALTFWRPEPENHAEAAVQRPLAALPRACACQPSQVWFDPSSRKRCGCSRTGRMRSSRLRRNAVAAAAYSNWCPGLFFINRHCLHLGVQLR